MAFSEEEPNTNYIKLTNLPGIREMCSLWSRGRSKGGAGKGGAEQRRGGAKEGQGKGGRGRASVKLICRMHYTTAGLHSSEATEA